MITCSPPRFALQPSRVIDASSHLLFRAAGVLGYLLAVLSSLPPDIRMGRIAVHPDQVVVLDFETRLPSPVTAPRWA